MKKIVTSEELPAHLYLLECPFCGTTPEVVVLKNGTIEGFTVDCNYSSCSALHLCSQVGDTIEEAVNFWNTRSTGHSD